MSADETWKVIAFIRSIYKGDPSRIVAAGQTVKFRTMPQAREDHSDMLTSPLDVLLQVIDQAFDHCFFTVGLHRIEILAATGNAPSQHVAARVGAVREGVARRRLHVNETTHDGRFTLKEGECMGACAMAPVLLVNNKKMVDYMSNEKLDRLLEELK